MNHAPATADRSFDVRSLVWIVVGALIACANIVYCNFIDDSPTVIIVGFILIAISLIVYLVCSGLRQRGILTIRAMIVIIVATCGVYYLAIFPPFTVPDEPYHYIASYMLANDVTGVPASPDDFMMRDTDRAFLLQYAGHTNVDLESYELLWEGQPYAADGAAMTPYDFSVQWPIWNANPPDENYQPWPSRATNMPQYKFVTVAALLIARLIGLDGVTTFYLGRVFALAYFVLLVYIALRLLPMARKLFAVIFLLPMTLHLAGSYSYDSPMLGYVFILIALYLRAIYGKDELSTPMIVLTIVFSAFAFTCKPIYLFVCTLGFLVPKRRFSSKIVLWVYRIAPFTAALLVIALFRLTAIVGLAGASLEATRGEGSSYTLSDIFTDPIGFLLTMIRTAFYRGDSYVQEALGGSLGWLQPEITAPWALNATLIVILALTTVRVARQKAHVTDLQRLVFFGVFIVSALLALVSMYLGHTADTEPIVMGVQGRYFLPVLPLLLLACQNGAIVMKRTYTQAFIAVMLLVNTMYPAILFAQGFSVVA